MFEDVAWVGKTVPIEIAVVGIPKVSIPNCKEVTGKVLLANLDKF